MELKTFIKSTILQIIESVEELNEELKSENVSVNPTYTNDCSQADNLNIRGVYHNITQVDFDLTVTASDSAEKGGKIGVMASIVGVGVSSKEGNQNSSVSKLRFTIPVMLPSKNPYKVDAK